MTRILARAAAVLVIATIGASVGGGCAKNPVVPGTDTNANGRYLNVRLQYRGAIRAFNTGNGGGYYIVINRTDNQAEPGPAPVVAGPPWGNGFAAPVRDDLQGFVGFVSFTRDGSGQGNELGAYNVFRVVGNDATDTLTNPAQAQFTYVGQPDSYTLPQNGANVIEFRLDLTRLPRSNRRYIQLNFIATDNRPVGVQPDQQKLWDALGDGSQTQSINASITLDASQNARQTNANLADREPANDVRDRQFSIVDDGGLDLVDWSVELRSS